jgi:integrase
VDATQTLKESTVQNHLTRRGARYYYRRRIPLDLLGHYAPSKELTKALGTSDPQEAARLARALAVKHDEEFTAIRALAQIGTGKAAETTEAPSVPLDLGESESEPSAESTNRQILSERVPSFSELVYAEAVAEEQRLRRDMLSARISGNLKDFTASQHMKLAANREALEGRESSPYPAWKLKGIVLAQQEVFESNKHVPLKWLEKTQHAASTQAHGPTENTPERVSMEQLVQLWRKDKNPGNARTVLKADLVVRRFRELQGDVPVQAVTRKLCVAFRDALRDSGQSIPNTNSYMDKLRALFAVAQSRDIITQNPAAGLSLKDPVPKNKKRKPFDTDSLTRVLGSPIYTGGERPKGGAGAAAYWLPLLALFIGARLEELGQLAPGDVREESYDDGTGGKVSVWVVNLTDEGEDQTLKNAGSTRRVPLHTELIRLGFVEFATAQHGKPRIFHELKPDNKGRETGLWSKWFGRWLRKECEVNDERIVFHSFRHTFKDLCRHAGMPEPVHDALTGHSGTNSVARSYGSDQYPLKPLAEGMQTLRLPAEVQKVLSALPQYRA